MGMIPKKQILTRKPNTGVRGALLTGVILPVLFAFVPDSAGVVASWRPELAFCGVAVLVLSFGFLGRWVIYGKLLGIIGCILTYLTLFPGLGFDPTSTLIATVSILWIAWLIYDYQPVGQMLKKKDRLNQLHERSLWAMRSLLLLVAGFHLMELKNKSELELLLSLSASIALVLFAHWVVNAKHGRSRFISLTFIFFFLIGLWYVQQWGNQQKNGVELCSLGIGFTSLYFIQKNFGKHEDRSHWWDAFFDNPARVMVTTFLAMCLVGTVLLSLPVASSESRLSVIDASFTAVSAVCVTGLIVRDSATDFSLVGQGFILLLIQLGGLGIMSIASFAVHLMGKRFSLQRERVFAEVVQSERSEMRASLLLIFKLTFIVELIGAVLLSLLFYNSGDAPGQAIWRGLFTAISGFCNAGFALQSESLIPYQCNAAVLHIVALLIIIGGMAPIAVVSFPKLLRGKRISVEAKIVWITSACLLAVGMIAWVVLEGNGLFANMSLSGKLQNAWFQSVTLRTAGFNSVDLTHLSDPMFLFSIILMFIGGSPGGTAGGVKTTTIAIIAMTFWMRARNRKELIFSSRLIQPDIIYQAITIFVAGLLLWVALLLMLDVTQDIPMRLLAFETTSALGTVGLTLGATPLLDEIGKILIILAMFAGRIGPLTLFMLLSEPSKPEVSLQFPNTNIHIG